MLNAFCFYQQELEEKGQCTSDIDCELHAAVSCLASITSSI